MELRTQPFMVNIGPQHPSTHGVFRLRVIFDGETIQDLEPVFGYLHRGLEKLGEGRTYTQCLTLTDRQDYLSAMNNNLAYVLAVEKLGGIPVPPRATQVRVLVSELQRIASHLFAIGAFINDLGAFFSPFMYMLREREKITDLFEMLCGQRLTHNFLRIGGLSHDLPPEFMPALRALIDSMPRFIDEYDQLLSDNEIIWARSKGVGVLPRDLAINASASGPVLRASGVAWDLRRADPYLNYPQFQFDIPTGENGDAYDRFRVRLEEMRQSVRIIKQAMESLPGGPAVTPDVNLALRLPKGEAYAHVESPRGELGYYLVSDGSINPYRFKVRAPSYINLTTLRELCLGWKLADAIVILGSLDIVLGEVDR